MPIVKALERGTKLCFFPTSLPDESVFSLIARYHQLSGNADDRDTLRELFGKHTIVVTSHLPSSIDSLVGILPSGVLIDAQGIINRHTIFPYYRPFLTERQISLGVAAMKSDSAIGLKTMMGLVASQVGGGNPYRFCAQCAEQDKHLYGQPYWHRAHQLPAVHICHEHGTALYALDASWVDRHRHSLFLPTTPDVINFANQIAIEKSLSTWMHSLSICSKQVLDAELGAISPTQLRGIYRDLASDLKLTHASGRLRVPKFSTWILQKIADLPTSGTFQFTKAETSGKPEWALGLLRKARKSTHPLKHLLLMHCLNGNWATVMTSSYKNKKPLPQTSIQSTSSLPKPSCVLSEQLRSMLVEDKKSLRHCAQLLGQSVTTLRVEATRLGLQVPSRPKTLNPSKLAELRTVLASTTSLNTLAQRHETSVVSLYRILRMYPDVAIARDKLISAREQEIRRKRFSLGCQKMLARGLPDYAWLYKHDRQWLSETIATTPKKKTVSATRIDWGMRDREFAEAVMKHSRQLYAIQKPVWVTKASIGRSMRKRSLLEKYLLRLPLTAQALAANIESIEDFQCRRLQWAALQVKQLHPAPLPWMLLRIAGLKYAGSGKVSKVLDELLNEAHDVI
ncbi:TnsD family Tn7-like transposition protein [Iodobacter sp. LRB]|uniref:TnsD family Tn7-like transposition protein n=1 Tax=unclassified Iodobacter TaxID=235634 RepID=UPI000C0EFBE4|nr:TnsD family Tn7-like transposition protein [Iodobacter sp. BJB302]PHV00097.1 hypothetical protein CSQ88_19005 [Iodobacter sp. BJB302]